MSSIDQLEARVLGIGHLLRDTRISVPNFQRGYSWSIRNCTELFGDLMKAWNSSSKDYFLGSIVVAGQVDGAVDVIDGQQRITTVAILLAALRDRLLSLGEGHLAAQIETDFLFSFDLASRKVQPHLTIGAREHSWFWTKILRKPAERTDEEPTSEAQRRLLMAARASADFVARLGQVQTDIVSLLLQWVEFLRFGVKVVVVRVPDHATGFLIFQSLNGRGQSLSKPDLLKSYLFSIAGPSVAVVEENWGRMLDSLDVFRESVLTDYLRHHWSATRGTASTNDVFSDVMSAVRSESSVVKFSEGLSANAWHYAALVDRDHPLWSEFDSETSEGVNHLRSFGGLPYKPLLLAALAMLPRVELPQVVTHLVALSFRTSIVGGVQRKQQDTFYRACQWLYSGRVRTAAELNPALNDGAPSDTDFEEAFANARHVTKRVAKYVLLAVERHLSGEPGDVSHVVPSSYETQADVHPVLPARPTRARGWRDIDQDVVSSYHSRLGNLVLLEKARAEQGSLGFKDKWVQYRASRFASTVEVSRFVAWTPREIRERQIRLASLAPSIWSLQSTS